MSRTYRSVPEPRFVRKAAETASGINIDEALKQGATDYNFMGDWIPDNEYHPNDLVIDSTDNNQYVCEKAIEGSDIPPSQDVEHWHLFLKGGLNVTHVIIDPSTAETGVFNNHEYEILTENTLNYIIRAGEIYRLSDESNASYLTYVHASIDTSQSDKPAVMRAIRVNLDTHAWELINYQLSSGSGGGGKLYEHHIIFDNRFFDRVINNSSEPFTLATYKKWLFDKGFTSYAKGRNVYVTTVNTSVAAVWINARVYAPNTNNALVGNDTIIYSVNEDLSISVTKSGGTSASGFSSIYDTVIEL